MPYAWADEENYFRIDLKVRNIGTKKDYLWITNIVIIDDLWNQYDYQYGGTLEFGEIYPGVIRAGSALFPVLNQEAESIRIIITKSEYPEDIVYEFTLDISEILREVSTISCSVTPYTVTQGESIIVSGSIKPSVSGVAVTLTYSMQDGSTFTRTVMTSSNGVYHDSYIPTTIGFWSVNASWEGDFAYRAASSQIVEFTVVEPPPIGSLEIIVQDINGESIIGVMISSTSQPEDQEALSVRVGTDGTVLFSGIKIGEYIIQASKSGYVTNSVSVTVFEGVTTTEIIQLKELVGTIIILINDEDGTHMEGAIVTSISQPSGQSALSGTSDSDGSVTFIDVKFGSYIFQASKNEYTLETKSISARAGETTKITITLEKEAPSVQIEEPSVEEEPSGGGGIPGFPTESIILGIVGGVFMLWLLQRRPRSTVTSLSVCAHHEQGHFNIC